MSDTLRDALAAHFHGDAEPWDTNEPYSPSDYDKANRVLDLLRSHPTECAAAIGMECVLARMFPTNDGTATKMIVIQGADSAWVFREEDA